MSNKDQQRTTTSGKHEFAEHSPRQKRMTGVLEPGWSSRLPSAMPAGHRFLRLPQVKQMTGLSKSTIYDRVQQGGFPAPVKLGNRAVGWVEQEIQHWIDQLIQARTSQ